MESASVPTIRLFTDYIQPLRDLGYFYTEAAFSDGILTELEYNFIRRQIGYRCNLPCLSEFLEIQEERMKEIASIIN